MPFQAATAARNLHYSAPEPVEVDECQVQSPHSVDPDPYSPEEGVVFLERFMIDRCLDQVYGDRARITDEVKDRYYELQGNRVLTSSRRGGGRRGAAGGGGQGGGAH